MRRRGFPVTGLTVMVNGDVDGGARSDLSAGGQRLSKRSEGCGVGAAGTADPRGVVTTISISRLPHFEQTSRSRQARTLVQKEGDLARPAAEVDWQAERVTPTKRRKSADARRRQQAARPHRKIRLLTW